MSRIPRRTRATSLQKPTFVVTHLISTFLLLLAIPGPLLNSPRGSTAGLRRWPTWIPRGAPAVAEACNVGVNYGTPDLSTKPISVSKAVDTMLNMGSASIKIFRPDPAVLTQLRGRSVEVTLGVYPFDLMNEWAKDASKAGKWIDANIVPWLTGSKQVKITALSVANEVIDPGKGADMWNVVPGMWAAYNQLKQRGLEKKIKVKTPQYPAFVKLPHPPSCAYIDPDIEPVFRQLLDFVTKTGSALYITNFPFYPYKDTSPQLNTQFTLFQGFNGYWDNGYYYQKLFDQMLDGVHVAAEKMGYKNVPLEVPETGWPSADVNNVASVGMARQYIQGLMGHICSGKGTPRRPGNLIKTWIFKAFDEDKKGPPAYEQHFGVRYMNGDPKFDLNLAGWYPFVAAKPPQQFCRAKPNINTAGDVDWACKKGGVTCAPIWSNCPSWLVASAVFNAYYQQSNWGSSACSFSNHAEVVSWSPYDSKYPKCNFPGYPPIT